MRSRSHATRDTRHEAGFFMLLVSCLVLILTSCQFKVPRDPEIIIQHLRGEPSILNPILANDAGSATVYGGLIYETLLDMDNKTLRYKPLLAEKWAVSKDHLQYTFYLRKGIKWHDGIEFTADDIVYSFRMIKDPKVDAAVSRAVYKDVKKVEAIDKYTVRFTYARPYFRALLICGAFPIIPEHIYNDGRDFNSHPANRSPIGTGPFIFKEWKTKQKVVLERNPNYWGHLPKLKGIVFRIVEDSTVAFQELKKREIDFAEIRVIQWERETGTPAFSNYFNKVEYYLPNYYYIGWNLASPCFMDKRVRRAMSMMIDKEAILAKILFGHAVIIEGDQYYFGGEYDHSIKPYPYNPAEAVRLLEEAGWTDHDGDGVRDRDGVPFRFDFYYRAESPFGALLSSMMREDLLKIGIIMEPRGLEFNALYRVIEGRGFDAALLAWAMPLENDPYQLWHSSQVKEGSNFVGFVNKDADAVIEDIRVEFDRKKRNELFKRLQKILHEEQPYTFLYNPATLLAYSKRFTNVNVYKVGVDIREWGVDKDIGR